MAEMLAVMKRAGVDLADDGAVSACFGDLLRDMERSLNPWRLQRRYGLRN